MSTAVQNTTFRAKLVQVTVQWVNRENDFAKVLLHCNSNYNPWLSVAKGGDLNSGFTPGFTSQMIFETDLAADFPLEPAKPIGSLMFTLGGPISGVTRDYVSEKGLKQTSEF